ncbi:MAG: hypothetical protein WAW11_00425 [Patescibacteria group bacterium]
MALCGFNEKMLKGLTAFNEGLVEHGLKFRSEKNGETIDQAIKREVSDMSRLLLELNSIEDTGKRVLTEGLVKYAMGFYLIIRSSGIQNYEEAITRIGEYFHFMDSKYYSELEGRADDMKELANFLNEKKI